MKKLLLLFVCFLMHVVCYNQTIELDGKVIIPNLATDNSADKVLASTPDGALVNRTVNSLSPNVNPPVIGDYYQGGIVFWTTADGKHGKVVSLYQWSANWSNIDDVAIGIIAASYKNGPGNSLAIVHQPGHEKSFAWFCLNYEFGGYSDWYAPSKDELDQIFDQKAIIESTAMLYGGDAFEDAIGPFFGLKIYGSSTENDGTSFWSQDFSNGNQNALGKDKSVAFRAIRAY